MKKAYRVFRKSLEDQHDVQEAEDLLNDMHKSGYRLKGFEACMTLYGKSVRDAPIGLFVFEHKSVSNAPYALQHMD